MQHRQAVAAVVILIPGSEATTVALLDPSEDLTRALGELLTERMLAGAARLGRPANLPHNITQALTDALQQAHERTAQRELYADLSRLWQALA